MYAVDLPLLPRGTEQVRSGLKILDMSAGNRAMWFNKDHPLATYLDRRETVNPTICCDTREMPPEVGEGYGLVVFDPPHVNFGANAAMSQTYGHHTTEEIRDIVKRSAKEAHRVSKPDALMAFKWNDHDQKLEKVLDLMAEWWEPLFGQLVAQRTKHACGTYWVMLRRKPPTNTLPESAETLAALKARVNGEFDNPALQMLGPLLTLQADLDFIAAKVT